MESEKWCAEEERGVAVYGIHALAACLGDNAADFDLWSASQLTEVGRPGE
jgi:hypothetical protein